MPTEFNFKGCLPSPTDVRDYKVKVVGAVEFPESFEVEQMPPVKNQRNINSCAAHALSTIMEYHDACIGNMNTLSTNFIYGIQKKYCKHSGQGMYLRHACKIAKDLGTPFECYCKGNNEVPKAHEIAEEAYADESKMQNASYFRIASYARCNTDNAIKSALMNYGPVLCNINWRDTFKINSKGILYGEDTGTNGYHALVIYGWNEHGWLIQNSWGSRWGNKGRFIFPYTYKFVEAWSIIDAEQDIDSAEDIQIITPPRNNFMDAIYKIINIICSFFSQFSK